MSVGAGTPPVTTELSSEDRALLRGSMRGYLGAHWGSRETRAAIALERGDPGPWREMASTLGIAGLLGREHCEGLGLGYREAVVVLEEAGRVLFAGPLFSSAVLATTALRSIDTPLTAALAGGRIMACVAIDDLVDEQVMVHDDGAKCSLSGAKTRVIDGVEADMLLVVARDDHGVPGLYALRPDTRGVTIEALDTLDRTRRMALLRFESAVAERLSGNFTDGLAMVEDVGAVAAASEQLGICAHLLAMAVDHAKLREQFGQPIGSFQAVKHMCADMLVRTECLRAAVDIAAAALDRDNAVERTECASIAKAYGSEAAVFAAQTGIQILGGLGFTWEHDAHLYLRRAKTLQFLFGDATHHRRRLAIIAGFGSVTG
jgi:alkylation response protein AidB-like acyl-CoA dehydrogenase